MEAGTPELILASYSWARRLHIVRFALERPFSLVRATSISLRLDSLRNPETFALPRGTRSVMRSLSKWTTKTLSVWPAISCVSMPRILPTPWVGYTTKSPVPKIVLSGIFCSQSHDRNRDASAQHPWRLQSLHAERGVPLRCILIPQEASPKSGKGVLTL